MDNFIQWELLRNYTTFVAIVYMVVEATKGIYLIRKMPTKYYSMLVSFGLLCAVNYVSNTFACEDMILYMLSSISISMGANGVSDFNKKRGNEDGI